MKYDIGEIISFVNLIGGALASGGILTIIVNLRKFLVKKEDTKMKKMECDRDIKLEKMRLEATKFSEESQELKIVK